MKKTKQNLIIFASSIFFLPSFFNSPTPSNSLEVINHQYQPKGINFTSWKAPTPNIKGIISYKTLTDEELNTYYQSIATKIPQPSDQQLNSWFEQYASQYQVSVDLLKSIAYCESHYNTNAINNIYWGMFQYSASTWTSTRISMGLDPNPELRLNPQESIKTSAFKIASGGIGAWPNCGK
jgi:hypothetical protein